jgi:hypothetical protein
VVSERAHLALFGVLVTIASLAYVALSAALGYPITA